MSENWDKLSAKFEVAFRYLESEKTSIWDKLHHIDIIVNYLIPYSDNDYIDGEINEYSEAFMLIEKLIDNSKDCRKIICDLLIEREDYELMAKITEPISETTERIIKSLNIF